MKRLLACLPISLLLLVPPQARASDPAGGAADRAEVQQLIEHFKSAIIAKDGASLRGMFLPGGSWLQGLDKASLDLMRTKMANLNQFSSGTYEGFAEFVSKAPKPIEEVFHNVRIETDGTVGMVYFDYQFLEDNKVQNHGVETWQLVHTQDGWKISAMLYSVTMDRMH